MQNKTAIRQIRRKRRVSSKINGIKERPRISVFRSNKYIYVQVIDDESSKTLASVSSLKLKSTKKITKTEAAKEIGKILAQALNKIKITQAVFDRNRFLYCGRVKAIAEGLREGGIKI